MQESQQGPPSPVRFPSDHLDVASSSACGRYLIAKEDLVAGQVVFEARPWLSISRANCKERLCQYCLYVDGKALPLSCELCQHFWYCSPECRTNDSRLHGTTPECAIWRSMNDTQALGQTPIPFKPKYLSLVRLLIRMICCRILEEQPTNITDNALSPTQLQSDDNVGCYADFAQLISNRESTQPKYLEWYSRIAHVVHEAFANTKSYLGLVPSVDELVTLLCIVQCNAFEISGDEDESYGISLYPWVALSNHSCQPNSVYVKDKTLLQRSLPSKESYENDQVERHNPKACLGDKGWKKLFMLRDVQRGEEVTISYIDLRHSSPERLAKLSRCWYFMCQCASCNDISESEGYRYNLRFLCCQRNCLGFRVPWLTSSETVFFCSGCEWRSPC